MKVLAVAIAFAALAAPASAAVDAPALSPGRFADPPKTARPCYRWWMPLAYTSDDELKTELQQIAASGAGCVEVSPFGVPGTGNDAPEFLKKYGWGSPLWSHRQAVINAEAARLGLSVDMNLGPNYPPTVPTVHDVNHPAAAQQLLYGSATVNAGSTYGGPPPPPSAAPPDGAKTHLLGVVAGRCAQPACSGSPVMLERSTMRDLTGRGSWTAPSGSGTWTVIAFWQTADGTTKVGLSPNSPNYVVDHLSVRGARALTSFLDDARLAADGIFEDSMEMGSHMKWTSDFMDQFAQRRGYALTKLLPALAGAGSQGTVTPDFDFSDGSGDRVRWDYRQTWSDLYIERYVKTLQEWAVSHGMQFRAQAYGEPIALGVASQALGVPEGESINFGAENPYGVGEDFRVLAAGAHVTKKTRISSECCGIFLGAYRSTVAGKDINQEALAATAGPNDSRNGNLDTIYKHLAGGATQIVWHGFPYCCAPAGAATSYTGEGGVWPGYNPWVIRGAIDVSEMFGPRAPQWDDQRAVNDNLARLQLLLRQGRAHPDFAVYYEDLGLPGGLPAQELGLVEPSVSPAESPVHVLGSDSAAARAGYTYEYLNPAMLPSTFNGAELYPDRAGYRALVINNQPTMPVAAARRILALARQGLPVVVIGDAPSSTPGFDHGGQDKALAGVVKQVLAVKNVKRIPAASDLPAALARVGLKPAATTNGLESVRRTAPGAEYYFLYNSSSAPVTQTVSFAGKGIPLRLDSWTGRISPIAQFQTAGGRVTLPVTVAPYDQTVIAVTPTPEDFGVSAPAVHALSSTAPELGYAGGKLVARSPSAGTFTTKLSSGRTATTAIAQVPAPMKLTSWTLRAQTWTPGKTDSETVKTWQPTAPVAPLPDGKLPSWLETLVPDLHNASGVGEYTTSVAWTGGDGAYLDLGEVADTVQVTVNGRAVPGLDQSNLRRIDVGPYLRSGSNAIVVRVATTLFNAVQANAALGHPGASFLVQPPQRMGLIGPVQLVPYGRATVTP